MRRLLGVAVVALLAGCGGGGAAKHPDGGHAGNAGGTAGAQGSGGSGGGGGGGAGGDAAGSGGTGGTAGGGGAGVGGSAGGAGGSAGADAGAPDGADAGDAAGDVVADAGGEVEAAGPRLVTVAFTGKVVTVANNPLGFDSTVRLEPVSGSFTYDLRLLDDQPNDPKRGKYQRAGTTAFTFTVKGHTVKGSGKAIAVIENLDPDTFRFLDGPQGDTVVRTMQLDGVDAPALVLFFAVTDSDGLMLASDALPEPFPALDIANKNNFKISHTFSLKDGGGTMLMQLDTLVSQ